MNLLNRTCAAGARPIGAPGCPELALKVASVCILSASFSDQKQVNVTEILYQMCYESVGIDGLVAI